VYVRGLPGGEITASAYDLRPLGDDPAAGDGDDLLADLLAESALAVRL